jgi:hypothetical protein
MHYLLEMRAKYVVEKALNHSQIDINRWQLDREFVVLEYGDAIHDN